MPTVRLKSRKGAGGGLLLITLDVPPELLEAYTSPGQYIEVTTADNRGYFALVGPVGKPWELLVKNAGGASAALLSAPLGSSLHVTAPLGTGFDLTGTAERPVVLAVVGSALGVARPVVMARIAENLAASTFLFIGLRGPTELPLPNEVAVWLERGVHVVLCLSRSELHHHPEVLPRAKRAASYVQDALARAVEAGDVPAGAVAVIAGPEAMLAELRARPRAAFPIEIVTNL